MITVVDYGVGNIGALLNMLDYVGIDARASSDEHTIARAEKLILPGVGAFDKAMSALVDSGLLAPLNRAVLEDRVPVLGVCLGMQLLGRCSEEGSLAGLGWIDAEVRRIRVPEGSGLKVPHIGWSTVSVRRETHWLRSGAVVPRFYFVHSFHMVCDSPDDVIGEVDYGDSLCCAVQRGHIAGVQFHPEKSHRYGMHLLSAWAQDSNRRRPA